MLLAPKPVPHTPSPSESRKGLMIGSSSLVIGVEGAGSGGVTGYEDLPDWVSLGEEPDPKLRDDGEGGTDTYSAQTSVPAARELDRAVEKKGLGKVVGKEKSLDDWLAEEEEKEESGEEGSTEEEEETSSESSEEETEEEESESEGSEEGDRLVRR